MCLDTDSIEKLNDASTRLRELHLARAEWRQKFVMGQRPGQTEVPSEVPLALSLDEGERIFHSRIVAIEASLDELGWRRTIRVEPERQHVARTIEMPLAETA